jgi:hypothetical protein
MQVSFKIRNQLDVKPEIFTQGIAKLVGEDDFFLGTTFRSYVSKVIDIMTICSILSQITRVLKS